MKRLTRTLGVAVLLACVAALALAAEAPAPMNADKAFEAAATWRFGQDEAPLIAVGTLVSKAHGDAKAAEEVEGRLVKLLETATPDCKRFVCRQLWMAGSAKAVSAAAKLLLDEDLTDAARYAIERMADPAAAAAALREAAGKAKGEVLVGIVNSLGHRRDAESVTILLPLLADKDDAVAASAAGALGRIGTPEAANALTAAREKAQAKLRPVLDDACLTCADALISASSVEPAAGPQKAAAAAIYQAMYAADQPRRLRIAALRGLMLAQPDKAAPTALEAMKGTDAQLAAVAAALLRELPGEGITQALAAELPKLPWEGQAVMLGVLAQRGGPAVRPAVVPAVGSTDPAVRAAAVAALGEVGSAQDVPLLAGAAVGQGGEPLRAVARVSLVRLAGKDVEPALVDLLKQGPPPVKVEVIRALSARSAGSAVPAIVALAGDEARDVRAAAFAALGTLAGEKEMPALLGLLVKATTTTEEDRAGAGKAISSTCARAKDKSACASAVLAAMEGAPAPARCLLLRVLPLVASDKPLAAARAAMKDADEQVRDAALRALSDWPTADGLDDLLAAAGAGGADQTHKVLALRGCVRVLGQPSDRALATTAELYERVLKLADRSDDKKFVVAGLAAVGHPDSLKLLEPLMSDAAVKAEAQAAAIKIALVVAGSDPALAQATVDKIAAAPANDGIKDSASAAAAKLAQPQDYILAWMLTGPYTEKDKTGTEIFNTAFPPEKADAKDVKWRQIAANKPPVVDLAALIGGEQCAAYLRTTVIIPAATPAVLEVGSNDGVKVWLNGKLIHSNNAARSLKLGQDKVKITLQAGENALMVEVVNGATDWETAVRIAGADGKAIAGMKVVAK